MPTQDRVHRTNQPLNALQGTEADLRAMKRALTRAQLGPVATLALTSAIVALQNEPRDRAKTS